VVWGGFAEGGLRMGSGVSWFEVWEKLKRGWVWGLCGYEIMKSKC